MLKLLQRLQIKDLTYVFVSILGRVVNIAYMLVAIAKVGSHDFGIFSFVQVTGLTLATLFTLAMTTSLNVILARDHDAKIGGQAASFSLCYVGVIALLLSPILIMPANLIHGLPATWGVRIGLYVFTLSILAQNIFQGWLFGFARTTYVAAVVLVTSLFAFAAILIAPRGDVYTLLTAYGSALALSALLMGFSVYRSSGIAWPSPVQAGHFAKEFGQTLVAYGMKSILNTTIFQLALWQLQAHIIASLGPVESAHYALGMQFYNVIVFIPVLIGPLLLNRLGKISGDPARAVRFTFLVTMACVVLAAGEFGSILAAFPFVSHFMPKAYRDSAPAIFWAIGAGTLLFVKTPMSVYFQSTLRAFPETVSVSLSAALLLSLSLFVSKIDASQAAEIRLESILVQLLTVAVFFILASRRDVAKPATPQAAGEPA